MRGKKNWVFLGARCLFDLPPDSQGEGDWFCFGIIIAQGTARSIGVLPGLLPSLKAAIASVFMYVL